MVLLNHFYLSIFKTYYILNTVGDLMKKLLVITFLFFIGIFSVSAKTINNEIISNKLQNISIISNEKMSMLNSKVLIASAPPFAGESNPFGPKGDTCTKVLGETFSALVKEAIKWVRIAGAIIAIVNAMMKLIPAVMSKDAEELNKAIKTCITMAIVLVFCVLFGWLLETLGKLFKWDVSCIVG